jgi:hypothetical protein
MTNFSKKNKHSKVLCIWTMYGQKYFAYGQKSGQGPIPTALTIWANFFGKTQQMLQSLVC